MTNADGLFTRAEFTIAAKEKRKVRCLIPSSRRRRHDGNDDGGRHRRVAPRLRSWTPSHCLLTDAGAHDARMNLRSTMCNYCRQITGAALHDY